MKQPNLVAALAEQAGSTRRRMEPAPVAVQQREESPPRPSVYKQPGRLPLVPITAHFPREVRRQLKGLAFDLDRTMHDLIAEAFNDLFAKHNKAEIAPREVRS
jgi:hypothetical protein